METQFGDALTDYTQATSWDIARKESYQFRVAPTIISLNSNQGTSAGQVLEISGFGFSNNILNNTVNVEGRSCKILKATNSYIQCEVQPGYSQNSTHYVGPSGLKFQLIETNQSVNSIYTFANNVTNDTNYIILGNSNLLETEFIGYEEDWTTTRYGRVPTSYYGAYMKGYFIPPISGVYQFRLSADDQAVVYMSTVAGSTLATDMAKILDLQSWKNPRSYMGPQTADGQQLSAPLTLVGGDAYYTEVAYRQASYGASITLSVETPLTESTVNTIPEIRVITIYPNITLETIQLNITNATEGNFRFSYNNTVSSAIEMNATDFATQLNEIKLPGHVINVTMYDTNGTMTTNSTLMQTTSWVFEIQDYRKIQDFPVLVTSKLRGDSIATNFTHLDLPSIRPTGIVVVNYNNTNCSFPINADNGQVQAALTNQQILFKIRLGFDSHIQVYQNKYMQNDFIVQYTIEFIGTTGTLGSGFTYNTTGVNNYNNKTITVNDTISRVGTARQFFQPVPAEMWGYAETKPSVIVTTNLIRSSCPNQNCVYDTLDTDVPIIESYTFSNPDLVLTLSANTIVNTTSTQVLMNGVECQISALTATSITCKFPLNSDGTALIDAGAYMPRVLIKTYGYALYAATCVDVVIPLLCNHFNPASINALGGAQIMVQFSGIYSQSDSTAVYVGGFKAPDPQFFYSDHMVVFQAPTASQIVGNNYTIAIAFNGQFAHCTPDLQMTNTESFTMTAITPQITMPTYKGDLNITGTNFGTNISNIQVQLVNVTGNKSYNLPVFKLTDTLITAFLPGGDLGTYTLSVNKLDLGANTAPANGVNTFKYDLTVTSITPKTGSIFGGLNLTVTGTGFNTQLNRNQIFFYIGNYNQQCVVTSATSTQLTCQIEAVDVDAQNVFLSSQVFIEVDQALVFNATCPPGECVFTFTKENAIITSLSKQTGINYNDLITITGANFTAQDNLILRDMVTKEILQIASTYVSATSFTFNVPQLFYGVYDVILNGTSGFSNQDQKIEILPQFASVNGENWLNNVGKLVLTGFGFPRNLQTSDLAVVQAGPVETMTNCVVTNSTSSEIACLVQAWLPQNKYNLTYGKKLGGGSLSLYSFSTYQGYNNCTNVVAAMNSGTLDVTLTGKFSQNIANFQLVKPATQNSSLVVINGSMSDLTQTATQITVSFKNIEVSGTGFQLYLLGADDRHVSFASAENQMITLDMTMDASNLQMSYAGGDRLNITGLGLSNAKFYACDINPDYECKIVANQSGQVTCETPQINTLQSQALYQSAQNQSLIYEATYDRQNFPANVVNDNDLTTYYVSYGTNCYIDLNFGQASQVHLQNIKFFVASTVSLSSFQGAVIQGYTNGNWVTLMTMDAQNLISGWNNYMSNQDQFYSIIRLTEGSSSCNCRFAEIEVFGQKFIDQSDSSQLLCDLIAISPGNPTVQRKSQILQYMTSQTPVITQISPTQGTSAGGTAVSITGTFTNGNVNNVVVFIDNVPCAVTSVSSTVIQCTSAPRPIFVDPKLDVFIDTKKAIMNKMMVSYLYIDKWSEQTTWGGAYPPTEGNLVSIPKGQNILLDVSTPILNTIVIEGRMIVADANITLQSTNILVMHGGYFEVGTPQNPIQNNVNIILYGDKVNTKQLPMFGNKVIGVMNSKISMHGRKRNCPWTYIASSINAGDSQLTLINTQADWQAGERIVVASTSFEMDEAEERFIVSNSNGVITVNQPFRYFHYSAVETYGGAEFPMRAEVALLSRNVVFKGSDTDSEEKTYGAHIMMMGSEQSGTRGTFSNIELTQVGQSTIIGKYPIHFHKCGAIPASYVDSVACHNSYSRFVTLHGVSYVQVSNSVAYNSFGHQYFIEDGSETKNTLDGNLAMNAKQVWTLSNTDVSVANYWVTNPDNLVKNCNAAGTMFYGFWYELMEHPLGPTTDVSICPSQTPLLGFFNNTAHTNGKFGLRIKRHAPVQNPCASSQNDNVADPWAANPPVTANYRDFKIWKSVEKGIQAELLGAVTFSNMMIADSGMAGLDIQIAEVPNQARIENILVIGATNFGNPPNLTMSSRSRGLFLPRTDNVFVSNVTFWNFGQQGGSAAVQTASTSENQCQRRQDGATYPIEKVSFNNVTRKVIWNGAFKRDIIQDLDGTFTGNNKQTWILVDRPHLRTTQCEQLSDTNLYGKPVVSCQDTFMRKISFFGATPNTIQLFPFRIVNTRNNISNETFQTIQNMDISVQELPRSWSFALQSGENYYVQVHEGSKWQKMNVFSWFSRGSSEPLSIVEFNVTSSYELFDVTQRTRISGPQTRKIYNLNNCSDFQVNKTLLSDQSYPYGNYTYNNGTKGLQIAINGQGYGVLGFTAIPCRYNCPDLIDPLTGRENFFRVWSDPVNWPKGVVPQPNEDVLIPYEWQLQLDMSPNPIKDLVLEGNLIFLNNVTLTTLKAKNIWVKQGNLMAGAPGAPFTSQAVIETQSGQYDDDLVVASNIYAGNNVIFNSANISLYGVVPGTTQTRLTASVNQGENVLMVENMTDWKVDDRLVLSTSEKSRTQNEVVTIAQIEGNAIMIKETFNYFHYGNATGKEYSLGIADMRTSVGHLTRNIVIKSSNSWNCRIYSASVKGATSTYQGQTTMVGVEIQGCGQSGSGVGAFDTMNLAKNLTIMGSTLSGAKTFGIRAVGVTGNVCVQNNVIFDTYNSAILVSNSNNGDFQNNMIIGMVPDPAIQSGLFAAAVNFLGSKSETQIIKNNIVRGVEGIGFAYVGYDCSVPNNKAQYLARYSGNEAGSTQVGLICFKGQNACLGCTNFTAYANQHGFDSFENVKNLTTDSMLLIENDIGSFTFVGNDEQHFVQNTDHVYDAMPRLDCESCYNSNCGASMAFNLPFAVTGGAGQKPPQGMDMTRYISICSESPFGMDSFNQNFTFINFKSSYSTKPKCTASRVITFGTVPKDVNSVLSFRNTKMIDVDLDQFILFATPNPQLASWEKGCGKIICTGLINVLVNDIDGSIFGTPAQALPPNAYSNVINNTNCVQKSNWNGYQCSEQTYGVLRFLSVAWDARKVMNIPVLFRNDQSENQLNMLWEWNWGQDGNPLDDRLQAYWTLFQYKNQYEIVFPGMVPSKMKLLMNRDVWQQNSTEEWLLIHYQYQDPSSFSLSFENGTKIQNTFPQDNYTLTDYTNTCGQNLVDFQNRTLTMVMNKDPNCVIIVSMLSVVKVTMRFSTSFEDFYKNNGKATLVDKLAAFLGVGQDQISIVSVRAGSTVIDYHITPTADQQSSGDISSIMSTINAKLADGINNGGLDLSAIGTVTSFSSTVTVVSNKPAPVTEVPQNPSQSSSNGLNTLEIVLIVLGCLIFVGGSAVLGHYKLKKRAQVQDEDAKVKNVEFQQLEQSKNLNNQAEYPSIANNQVSDRNLIDVQFQKQPQSNDQYKDQINNMNENALFKIKDIQVEGNRVTAAENLQDHIKRPTQKDRQKVQNQDKSISTILKEIDQTQNVDYQTSGMN